VGLWPLTGWDCKFESCWRHECVWLLWGLCV